ncbi:MAG: hypothetical protein QMD16_16155 [Desulfitobacteriaceae bacterium]|nr:hypothetical protein [Desulfitobacteriaceae bacterium]
MRKKLNEIVSRYTWSEVEPIFLELYPKEKRKRKRARQAWEYIQSLEPPPSDMRLYIELRKDPEESYHDVFGKDGSLGDNGQEETYALFLVDWDEWLGMEIAADTLEQYAGLHIVCHCFWEMTWCGYVVESVRKYREKLARVSKEETRNLEE